MQEQEQVLMDKYSLKIKNQKMENDYQQMEKKLQRKALFPIIILYQLGFFINYITKIIKGITLLGIFVDASTNISLFFLIITMKVNRFKKYSHISFFIMCVIMQVATVINSVHDYQEAEEADDENRGLGFDSFYLGATLFGIILGPNLSYRLVLMVMFSSLYAIFIIYEPENQRPLSGFIVISHFTLYFYKIYQEEKQKRKFYISTQKVNFWESIIQNVLLINLIVVKYDKEQQRLVLEKSNKTAMGNIKVKSNEDLQQFLEQTKIKIQSERTQEDSYSVLLDQDTSATRLTKMSRDRKSKFLGHSKTVVGGDTFKINNIRGSSNSSHITLKELVKEKLHQKQLNSKKRGSSFGLGGQSVQSFNGQYQYNSTGDIMTFNLKVICFGMIEDYALICVEDETYKEKFSNQFQKNSFLLNILGDVMHSQKQEIQNIHKQLDQGIQAIQTYYKGLQSVYPANSTSQFPNLPTCTISELAKTTNLTTSITNNYYTNQIILQTNNSNSAQALLSDANKISPTNSPINQKRNVNINQQLYQPQHIELVNKSKRQSIEVSQFKLQSANINDSPIILKNNKNPKGQILMDQLIDKKVENELKHILQEEDINLGIKTQIDNIVEDKEFWNVNDCLGNQSQSLINKQAYEIPCEQKGQIFTTINPPHLNNTSPNLSAINSKTQIQQDFQQEYKNILKERIKYTIKCRTTFLKLYSQVSKMQMKISNLDNYLKGERKINCVRADIFLSKTIYSILSQYRFEIETRKIKIVFQNLCTTANIHQDPEILSNILQNLIQNAIDYNQQQDGFIEIKIEDETEGKTNDKSQIRITLKNSIPIIDEQKVELNNYNFQKQIKGIYFGMERDSIQLSQIRYDKYFFGLRIAQKNVRCIGPLNKIHIQFTTNTCEASFIIYSDINILNFKA